MIQKEKLEELNALYRQVQDDPQYRNENMGSVFVPGRGLITSPLVFIGEAPGREEERERTPFVGPAGRNLNALLKSIGLSRDDVFITNLVKYRPRDPKGDNRAPSTKESRYALPYLREELNILSPEIIVCLGLSSAKALLEKPGLKMSEVNGVLLEMHGRKVFTTYHPSPYNYKIPEKREAMESAFQELQRIITAVSE